LKLFCNSWSAGFLGERLYFVGLRVAAAAPEAAACSTPSQGKVEGGQRAALLEARPVCRRWKGRGGRPVVPFCVSQPVVDRQLEELLQ